MTNTLCHSEYEPHRYEIYDCQLPLGHAGNHKDAIGGKEWTDNTPQYRCVKCEGEVHLNGGHDVCIMCGHREEL